ncbi:MAG TPA: hypothetical protein VGC03_02285 [Acidimicrobiia bacterium]|jgi:hypothetical protein
MTGSPVATRVAAGFILAALLVAELSQTRMPCFDQTSSDAEITAILEYL